jgi:hypothetical protein
MNDILLPFLRFLVTQKRNQIRHHFEVVIYVEVHGTLHVGISFGRSRGSTSVRLSGQ